jgi:hypothetical protein
MEKPMDIENTIAKLKGLKGAKIFEAYHCTTIRAYRKRRDGVSQELTIEILDAGPDVGSANRYSCTVSAANGKKAIGNAAESIDAALDVVHWVDLD